MSVTKPKPLGIAKIVRAKPMTSVEIAAYLGASPTKVRTAVRRLEKAKKVKRVKDGDVFRYYPFEHVVQPTDIIARILGKAVEEGDCLLWTGCKCPTSGNPLVRFEGNTKRVQNVLWKLLDKEIPEGKSLLMSCGNKLCVLPEHTKQVNRNVPFLLAGKAGKFSTAVKRAKIAASKIATIGRLNPDMVNDIRMSEESTRAIARRLGVHQSTVQKCKRGESYRDYSSPFTGLGAR